MRLTHPTVVSTMWLLLVSVAGAQQIDRRHYVYIEASAIISARADTTTIQISISEKAETTQAAIDATIDKSIQLFEAIDRLGISRNDIETGSFTFEKVYVIAKDEQGKPVGYLPDPDRDRFDGFRATNTISVELLDPSKAGSILSLAAALGAEVNTVSFSSSREDEYTMQAKKKAADGAREKAEMYAAAIGARLGDVLAFKEGSGYDPDTMEYQPVDGEADLVVASPNIAVPIAPPTLKYSASVSAKWEIASSK